MQSFRQKYSQQELDYFSFYVNFFYEVFPKRSGVFYYHSAILPNFPKSMVAVLAPSALNAFIFLNSSKIEIRKK